MRERALRRIKNQFQIPPAYHAIFVTDFNVNLFKFECKRVHVGVAPTHRHMCARARAHRISSDDARAHTNFLGFSDGNRPKARKENECKSHANHAHASSRV